MIIVISDCSVKPRRGRWLRNVCGDIESEARWGSGGGERTPADWLPGETHLPLPGDSRYRRHPRDHQAPGWVSTQGKPLPPGQPSYCGILKSFYISRLWTFLTKTKQYLSPASRQETPSSSRWRLARPGLRRRGRARGQTGRTRDRRLRLRLGRDPLQVCRGRSSQLTTVASSLPSTTACPGVWSPVSTVPWWEKSSPTLWAPTRRSLARLTSGEQYCTWILTKDAWGGAIEVQILAEYFQVEIVVVDTKSGWIEQAIIRLQVPIHNSRKFNGVRWIQWFPPSDGSHIWRYPLWCTLWCDSWQRGYSTFSQW